MTIQEKLKEIIQNRIVFNPATVNIDINSIIIDCENIINNIAIQYGLFRNPLLSSEGKNIMRANYNKSKEDIEKLLFQYFLKNIYIK